jgi:hypothetical protein
VCRENFDMGSKVWSEDPEGKREFGRPLRRCENNFKFELNGNGRKVVVWINLAQDRD